MKKYIHICSDPPVYFLVTQAHGLFHLLLKVSCSSAFHFIFCESFLNLLSYLFLCFEYEFLFLKLLHMLGGGDRKQPCILISRLFQTCSLLFLFQYIHGNCIPVQFHFRTTQHSVSKSAQRLKPRDFIKLQFSWKHNLHVPRICSFFYGPIFQTVAFKSKTLFIITPSIFMLQGSHSALLQ